MTRSRRSAYRYQAGGSLRATDPTYVYRDADDRLYDLLKAGEFCYVFNCRQMGKSSLRVRTMKRLMAEQVCCLAIDLTMVGSEGISADAWYKAFIMTLHDSPALELSERVDLNQWFAARQHLQSVQLLNVYLKQVLLGQFPDRQFAIFIDEIDHVLHLNFDISDFFGLIRACFNGRVDDAEYDRLTFALFGVATPANLIQDSEKTPFNIGQAVLLSGFEFERSLVLAEGLVDRVANPEAVLREILAWTGGQPFLTQKLCSLAQAEAVDHPAIAGQEAKWVEQLVRSRVIENWETQDDPIHLRTIRDRVLRDEVRSRRRLGLYQQILQQGEIAADQSEDQFELCLSGLVVQELGKLRVYDRIYQTVFDRAWVEQQLAQLRPYVERLNGWLASGGKDESQLLRGQELLDQLAAAKGKHLADEDYRFFAASQDAELSKVRKRIRWGVGVLGVTIVGAIAASLVASQAIVIAKKAEKQLTQTEQQLKETQVQEQRAQQDKQKANEEKQDAEKNVRQKQRSLAAANNKLIQAEQQVGVARQKEATARSLAMTANQDRKQAQAEEQTARSKTEQAEKLTEQAQREQRVAQEKLKEATLSLSATDVKLASADSREKLTSGRRFEALFAALRAGQQLMQLEKSSWSKSGTKMSVVAALQQSIYGGANEYNTLSVDGGVVSSVEFSPDGQKIAAVSLSGIKLWSRDGKMLATLQGHQSYVASIAFSPDGEMIASASWDKTIKLWSRDGKELFTLRGHQSEVLNVAFSPDGKMIASGDDDGVIKLWSRDGRELSSHNGNQGWVTGLAFSPNGQTIVSGGADGTVKLWSRNSKELYS
ncbi:MAG: AAA-like domain-containing protein [Phormidesmis sp. CAN_BIN44]|nr:AAA-like domain-containing protein [Phormidesmis sp. CAN_BIN44]